MEKEKTNNAKAFRKVERFVNANFNSVILVVLSLILIVSLISFVFGFGTRITINQKVEETRIAAIPVDIQLALIECNGCAEVKNALNNILKQNVNVTNQENLSYYDLRARELIEKYNLKKLPAVLIFGDIENNKTKFDGFERVDDALVLEDIGLPYLDLETNNLIGIVDIIEIVDSSCSKCVDLKQIPLALAQSGVALGDWKKFEYGSVEGKQIIEEYSLVQIPSLLISDEIDYYENVKQTLAQVGAIDKGEFYSLHSTLPPYLNLTNNKVVGLTDVIMITDENCDNCYDVNLNKVILARLGVVIDTENTYDVNSPQAKQLISKYTISKVPMFLISPEAESYSSLVSVWPQVGTIEDDGWFVMRNPELVGNVTSVQM